jgi:YVTN family beta-propeller protein
VAVTPDGSRVYVANRNSGTVSVIDTATNTVVGSPIPVGGLPMGVAVIPDAETGTCRVVKYRPFGQFDAVADYSADHGSEG